MTVGRQAVGFSFLLRIAALILFIIAALYGWSIINGSISDWEGLLATGLACWVASTVVP